MALDIIRRELPVFSPSRTEVWLKCPLKMQLQYIEGLEPKYLRSRGARIGGSGFDAGVTLIHTHWAQEGTSTPAPEEIMSQVRIVASEAIVGETEGYRVGGVEVETEDTLKAVKKSLEKYNAQTPLRGYTIKCIQKTFPDHGFCRIDLGVEKDGIPLVMDVKYKNTLSPDYFTKTVQRYFRSWQFLHYAWAYGEECGTPITQAGLMLVIAKPYEAHVITQYLAKDWPQVWLASARQAWSDMEDERVGLRLPRAAGDHEDQYGPCEMIEVCFEHGLDIANALKGGYLIRPEREKHAPVA